MTREDSLEKRTLRDMGELVAKAFGLACETRPHIMRVALSRVFDLKGLKAAVAQSFDVQPAAASLEKTLRLANDASKEIMALAHEFRRLKESIELDIENLESRLDALQSTNGPTKAPT